jgi:hypothetical protein
VTSEDRPVSPQLAALLRWEEHGAAWRVVARTDTTVTVSMRTCDGGTEVDRLTSDDPGLVAFVNERDAADRALGPEPPRSA